MVRAASHLGWWVLAASALEPCTLSPPLLVFTSVASFYATNSSPSYPHPAMVASASLSTCAAL